MEKMEVAWMSELSIRFPKDWHCQYLMNEYIDKFDHSMAVAKKKKTSSNNSIFVFIKLEPMCW